MLYKVKKISILNLIGQFKVNRILFDCGKDMAMKYNLYHWDNSCFKNFIIVLLCELKNTVYLVEDNGMPIATFQIKISHDAVRFEKLACSPKYAGKGIGSYCVNYIEEITKKANCNRVCMEVYSPSQHAIDFYIHRGYRICGRTETRKYSEVIMEKILE